MKRRRLHLVRCPICRGFLELHVLAQMFQDSGVRQGRDVTLGNEARPMVAYVGEK